MLLLGIVVVRTFSQLLLFNIILVSTLEYMAKSELEGAENLKVVLLKEDEAIEMEIQKQERMERQLRV